MIAYYNGEYLNEEDVHISPNDRGFMFADGAYEVVRSYGGLLFRMDRHMARLKRSLAALRISSDLPDSIPHISRELLIRNGPPDADALIYVQVTRGAYPRTHFFPPANLKPTHYVQLTSLHSSEEETRSGVSVILVGDTRWSRCDIKSLALLPNVLAAQEAREHGVREALFVRDGMVIEGSRSNFAGIHSGRLITPPESNYMLPGVSRGVVLELCERLGIPVEVRPIPEREISTFDELILIGTSAEVLSIVSVDGQRIGTGAVGPVSRRLKGAFGEEVERLKIGNNAHPVERRGEEIAG